MPADHSKLEGRYWPTNTQLIVVTGEPVLVAQWFDAVRAEHEAARDVIDLWDLLDDGVTVRKGQLADAVERLRHTLWQVRQWDVDT